MNIQPEVRALIDDALSAIPLPLVESQCPHCKLPIRYPAIAREAQVKMLDDMITAAKQWARDSGMTDDIIASIRAQCAIGKAGEKSDES